MRKFLALFAVVLVSSASFAANGALSMKWTNGVGEVITPIEVTAGGDLGGGRIVKVTYEAKKSCRNLALGGHSYTADGIQLAGFYMGQKMNVTAGQKFRDEFVIPADPGNYIVIDLAGCH